jgi:restriction system protein
MTQTIWGIHQEWLNPTGPNTGDDDIAIGWAELGDLNLLASSREAFKSAFTRAFPHEKAGAIPVKAGVLFRFSKEMEVGDVVVFPSKTDRMVNIGAVEGRYNYLPSVSARYPHRRRVSWKVQLPRAQFSQPALYEIGSAITLFQISNNADEFMAALSGTPFKPAETDAAVAIEIADQAEESTEDFIIKRLKNSLSPKQFEQFVAELLRSMEYHVRVTPYSQDGGIDIIAHRDELGFEPPIIKVQCKQTLSTIGAPDVQKLLGAIQHEESALFVTLGEYSPEAARIERQKSNLRLISGVDLVKLILTSYEKLDPKFKSLIPLKRSYSPSAISTDDPSQ